MQDPATGAERFVVVPASYVFFLRDDGDPAVTEVLLQLRRGTGYMDEHWAAAAAGHVERGETAEDAARREAAEEVDVTDLGLEFLTAMQRTAHDLPIDERVDFFFAARSWTGRAADRGARQVRRPASGSRSTRCPSRSCRTSGSCWMPCAPARCRR